MPTDPLPELSRLTAEKEYVPTSVGLSAGSEGLDVTRLQRYLQNFGYTAPTTQTLPGTGVAPVGSPTPGVFDERTVEALERFQQFNGLPVTGELDAASLGLMHRPRCGVPDRFVSFVAEGSKWDHTNLTYAYQNFTPDLTDSQVRAAVSQAFSLWAAVVPLSFAEVALGASPDIVIRFVAGAHGDGHDFDGPGGTYAHGFYPPPDGDPFAGDVHFDEDETWSVDLPPTGIDLVSLAAHEIGHALGLDHSAITDALMYAFYLGPHRFLSDDDIQGIQSIYGRRYATLLSDEFNDPLATGSGYWGSSLPPVGDLNAPTAGDGFLHLYAPQSPFNAYQTSLASFIVYPLRCATWTMVFGTFPFADIYAGDFFGLSFSATGDAGTFTWNLRWQPATVPFPETPGTDTEVVMYASWFTVAPFADSDASTPITFDPIAHKHLRIREECLALTWEYSADGATWTEGFTATLPDGFSYGDYGFAMGMRAGVSPTIDMPIDSAKIELVEDCACGGTGWRLGGPKSGSTPW